MRAARLSLSGFSILFSMCLAFTPLIVSCWDEGGEGTITVETPVVDPVVSPTSEPAQTITGTSVEGYTIRITGGAEEAGGPVLSDTTFAIEVQLNLNAANTLWVQAEYMDSFSEPVELTIIHDDIPPDAPVLNPVESPTTEAEQTISGYAEPESFVTVTGAMEDVSSYASSTGNFSIDILLNEYQLNTLYVFAEDAAGNVGESAMVEIEHMAPIAPPLVDPVASPTNQSTINLTGSTEGSYTITVSGGAVVTSITAEADGTFSIPVYLLTNTLNTLEVVASYSGIESDPTTVEVEHDDIPPGTPAIDPVTSPTSSVTQVITGTAEIDSTVNIAVGPASFSDNAGASGAFSIEITLQDNTTNTLLVTATDAAGNVSDEASAEIVHDDIGPSAPILDDVESPTNRNPIDISGATEPDVDVYVTGGSSTASGSSSSSGDFSISVTLVENSSNTLNVYALDGAGNVGDSATVIVVHDDLPPSTPAVDPVTSPTNISSQTITGTSDVGTVVTIEGGASTATGSASTDGTFSVTVSLNEDTTNTLTIYATDEAGNDSASTTATIVHDGTPPSTLTVNDVVSPTNIGFQDITGTTEADATITITGGLSDATGTASSSGGFSVTVYLNENTTNTLTVVASDEVGNESESVVVSIVHDDIPPDPPEVTELNSPTNSVDSYVMGIAEEGSYVEIDLDGTTFGENADEITGEFYIEITLAENTDNDFTITATDQAGNTSDPASYTIVHDSIAPSEPSVDPVTSPTSETTATISGTAEAGSTVYAILNGVVYSGEADEVTGEFSITLTLEVDEVNTVTVYAVDGAGNESDEVEVEIEQDSSAPSAPRLYPVTSPTNDSTQTIQGRTEAYTDVVITGGLYDSAGTADSSGYFSITVYLFENSTNTLTVISYDESGNASSPAYATIIHDDIPPDPPSVSSIDSYINDIAISLSGTAEASSIVTLEYGSTSDYTVASSSGAFSFSASLTAGTSYTFTFIATDGAGNESDAATLSTTVCSERDTYEDTGDGDSCSDPVDLGTISDDGSTTFSLTGNILPTSEADWFKFLAYDNNSYDSSVYNDNFYLDIYFSRNDNTRYAIQVYRNDCSNMECSSDDSYYQYTFDAGESPCGYSPYNNCSDNSAYYYVRVVRLDTTPSCDTYTLVVENGS